MLSPADVRRLLWGSYLGMVIVAASLNALPVCLTGIGRTFALASKAQLGAIASAMFAGRIPAILSAGPLADRWGLRPLLVVGAVGTIAGLGAMGLAPGYPALLGAAVIAGAFSGVFDVLLDPLVCELKPSEKTSALNLMHAFYPVGAVATVAVSNGLLWWTGSWRVVLVVMGVPAAMYLVFVVPCRFPQLQREGQRTPLVGLLSSPLLLVIVGMMLIAAITELGPAQWLPAYLERVFSWPRSDAANMLLAFNILMGGGRFAISRISGHVRPAVLLSAAGVCCGVCLIVAATADSGRTAAAALVVLGSAVACMWPSTVAYAADRFPDGGATMFSLLVAAGNAGGILGPAIVGAVGDYAGLPMGMGILAVLPLISAIVFTWRLVAGRRGR